MPSDRLEQVLAMAAAPTTTRWWRRSVDRQGHGLPPTSALPLRGACAFATPHGTQVGRPRCAPTFFRDDFVNDVHVIKMSTSAVTRPRPREVAVTAAPTPRPVGDRCALRRAATSGGHYTALNARRRRFGCAVWRRAACSARQRSLRCRVTSLAASTDSRVGWCFTRSSAIS